tara:strand:- start:3390 stop:3773 length:384 start_codon:yes stop_codon:yes gene_type:complete
MNKIELLEKAESMGLLNVDDSMTKKEISDAIQIGEAAAAVTWHEPEAEVDVDTLYAEHKERLVASIESRKEAVEEIVEATEEAIVEATEEAIVVVDKIVKGRRLSISETNARTDKQVAAYNRKHGLR